MPGYQGSVRPFFVLLWLFQYFCALFRFRLAWPSGNIFPCVRMYVVAWYAVKRLESPTGGEFFVVVEIQVPRVHITQERERICFLVEHRYPGGKQKHLAAHNRLTRNHDGSSQHLRATVQEQEGEGGGGREAWNIGLQVCTYFDAL